MCASLFSRPQVYVLAGALVLGASLALCCQAPTTRAQPFPMEERAVLKRLPSIADSVVFSRDGKWLATIGGDTVKVWDAATHECVRTTLAHWRRDTDLAGVRANAALAGLPGAERQAWQRLWADVEAILKRVPPPPRKGKQ